MCGEGIYLVGVSNPFLGWAAGWAFVSAFNLLSHLSLASLDLAIALGKHPLARTLKHLLAPPRRTNSSYCSRVGLIRYTVSYSLRFVGIRTYLCTVLAPSDHALFTTTALVGNTQATAAGSGTTNDQNHVDTPSSPLSSFPSNRVNPPVDPPAPNEPHVQSSVTLNHLNITPEQLERVLTQPAHVPTPGQLDATSAQPTRTHSQLNVPAIQLNTSSMTPQPTSVLVGVTDEPAWMKKRRTLNYFRDTFKLGSLPSVIENWYELEKLLGFPDTVSVPK